MGYVILVAIVVITTIASALNAYLVLERIDKLEKKVDNNTKIFNKNSLYFHEEIEKNKTDIELNKNAIADNGESVDRKIRKLRNKMDDIVADVHTIDHNTNDIRRYYFNYITPANELVTEPEPEVN